MTGAEGRAIGDLLLARIVVSIVVSAWRVGEHPDNTEYIGQYDDASWTLLRLFSEDGTDVGREFARLAGAARAGTDPMLDLRSAARRCLRRPLLPSDVRRSGAGRRRRWPLVDRRRRHVDTSTPTTMSRSSDTPTVSSARRSRTSCARSTPTLATCYPHGVELAERLLATMPPDLGFDTCIFLNSGSEAVDLAWRLAVSSTGRAGALVGDSAYHGITTATEAFSSNEWPSGHHPGHVATFKAPYDDDGFTPGQVDASTRVDAAVAELADRGHRPALLLADPLFTSAGILDPTPDFMAALGDRAHHHGGLVLADEVQSGFGRVGPSLVGVRRCRAAPRPGDARQAHGQRASDRSCRDAA